MAQDYSSSDDELPDLDVLLERLRQRTRAQHAKSTTTTSTEKASPHDATDPRPASGARRRNLVQGTVTSLRKPLGRENRPSQLLSHNGQAVVDPPTTTEDAPKRPRRRQPQPRRPHAPVQSTPPLGSDHDDVDPAVVISSDSASDFGDNANKTDDDDDGDTFYSIITSSSPHQDILPSLRSRQPSILRNVPRKEKGSEDDEETKATVARASGEALSKCRGPISSGPEHRSRQPSLPAGEDVAESLARLNLTSSPPFNSTRIPASPEAGPVPLTPPRKGKQTLISPRKLPPLPKTPHRPSMDLFWDQGFVNEWNEECSPRKLVLPPPTKSPVKESKKAVPKPASGRVTKKAFEQSRHQLAEAFLAELDDTILQGQLRELAQSTGGVKIEWSKKLNTTAGRANWKKETLRSRAAGSTETVTSYRHHATIELAEKVIDDEHRLLNVIAHEFCHLANFMVSGITGNPHGKEFKAWAAQVSRAFGARGIEVTTKHSYDIDFKYVWTCTACATDFKRHSRSINTERHRCGACKGLLQQTKPVPRKTGGKKSEYQQFVQEQMPIVKRENPGSPQKGMMRLVAQKWAHRTAVETESKTQKLLQGTGEGEVHERLGDYVQ